MPSYVFQCKKCEEVFDEVCTFADFDAKFPKVHCPKCNSKSIKKNIYIGVPGASFANPRESSKWDNWSYRQGKTAEEAKMTRAAAEAAQGKSPYRKIDDTDGGRRMNFID